jgi:hypothetical protein
MNIPKIVPIWICVIASLILCLTAASFGEETSNQSKLDQYTDEVQIDQLGIGPGHFLGEHTAGPVSRNDSGNTGDQEPLLSGVPVPANIQWQKCLGGSSFDSARGVQQTSDGGYIVAGGTASNDGDVNGKHGLGDGWVVKLNLRGAIQNQICIGGSSDDWASSIQKTSDGNYVVAGYTNSHDGDFPSDNLQLQYDGWVVKLNNFFVPIWKKRYGDPNSDDFLYDIQQTSDGGYIVVGSAQQPPPIPIPGTFYDLWLSKIDSNGVLIWERHLGGSYSDAGTSVKKTSDGGYIVVGYTYSNDGNVNGNHDPSGNTVDVWVAKLTSAGVPVDQVCLGGSLDDSGCEVQQTSDGGYIVAATTFSNDGDTNGGNHGKADFWVIKLDPDLDIVWQKCLGGPQIDDAYSVKQTSDGGYIVAGLTDSASGDVSGYHGGLYMGDVWVAKLNSVGDLKWQKCLGGSYDEWATSIQQTTDGGYIVAGQTNSIDGDVSGKHDPSGYIEDFWVVKLEVSDDIGLFRPSTARWYLDYDNNGLSNYQVTWGTSTDKPVAGDWDGDGKDEIGLFRPSTARWYLDYDNNGLSNYQVTWGASTDIPVAGDWDGDGKDEIGLFRPSTRMWYLDYDNNGASDYRVTWGDSTDIPVVGDWDGDGMDEIGLFRPSTARWYLDYDNNGASNYQVTWGTSTDKPVASDWDDDGKDEIGLFRPSTARWYLDYDNNGASNYQVTWGTSTDKPVAGRWS